MRQKSSPDFIEARTRADAKYGARITAPELRNACIQTEMVGFLNPVEGREADVCGRWLRDNHQARQDQERKTRFQHGQSPQNPRWALGHHTAPANARLSEGGRSGRHGDHHVGFGAVGEHDTEGAIALLGGRLGDGHVTEVVARVRVIIEGDGPWGQAR